MMGKNRYRTHRILMPDGSEFVFKENKNDAEHSYSDMLAINSAQRPDNGSASTNSISNPDENVKKKSIADSGGLQRVGAEDYTTDALTSVGESGIVETAVPLSSRYVNSHDPLHDNSANIKPIDGFEDIVDGTFTIGTSKTAHDGEMKLFYPKGAKK